MGTGGPRPELIKGPSRSADSTWNRPPAHPSRSAVPGEQGPGRADHRPGAAVASTSTDCRGFIRPQLKTETYAASDTARPCWTRPTCPPHGSARRRTRYRRKWVENGEKLWCLEGKGKQRRRSQSCFPVTHALVPIPPFSLLPLQHIQNSKFVFWKHTGVGNMNCHKISLSEMVSVAWLVLLSG